MNRLYRSQRDKKIFGLCGGLAESFNVDVTLLRLIVVITTIFSGGTVGFLYIVASLVVPKEPGYEKMDPSYTSSYDDGFRTRTEYSDRTRTHYSSRNHYEEEAAPKKDNIDNMMQDLEKKALWNEIEALKEKLKKYEDEKKGE